jgi:beta-phosphoglucomutase-like phosphatase (HAD superfamily)
MDPRADGLPRPRAVVLDLDGTLVDTVETRIRAWLAVFAESGIPATHAQVAPLIGSDGRWLAREVAAADGRALPEGGDEEIDRRSGEIYGGLNRAPRPLPGATAFLDALDERGIPWAIATSSRREQVAASVSELQRGSSPHVIDGSHVAHAKPAPDLLLRAAEELGVPAEVCWYIGDSTWDMRAAVAAGMVAVAVTAGAAVSEGELREAGAARVVSTLGDLVPQLAPGPVA